MKKKVIEFMSSLSDGGAETLVKDYACLLDKNIFDVCIVCIYPLKETANYKRINDNKIRTIYIYSSHSYVNRVARRVFGKWYIPFRLKRIIKKEMPDVIHVHLAQLKYLQQCEEVLTDTALFYTCHAPVEKMFSGENEPEKTAAKELINKHQLQLIALHSEMAMELNRVFNINNTKIVKNGVDFDKFRNILKSKNELKNDFGIDERTFIIGNIGRFSPQKNQVYILKMLKELLKRGIDARLLLIGSGPLEEEIKSRINEYNIEGNVVILSHRTDIPELLKMMDVFVFPSLFEGLSVTLVEAQVSGLRCVISDKINPESILSEKTVVVPLDAPIDTWVDTILDDSIVNNNYGDIDQFDLRKEIKNLEQLYLGN